MKLVKVLWALVASIYVVSSVHAAPPNWRSVNARTFDIAGVKLGMGYDEAISATANHFKLSPKEIKDLKEGTLRIDDFLAKSKIPGSFTLRKDGITFEVGFSGRTPSNKAQSVGVTSVRYAVAQTPENYSMLKEAAFAKYGTPSTASSSGGATAERVNHGRFHVVHLLDKTSPKLYDACCTGKHIKEVVIELYRAGGDKTKYAEIRMEQAIVASVDMAGGGDFPGEIISFSYGKISWDYIQQKRTDGTGGGHIAAGWDLTRNTTC